MGKIASNTISATDAISKIVDTDNQSLSNQSVFFDFSNISSMTKGAAVSNQIIGDMSKLILCVYGQADKIQQLANLIEQRDKQDSVDWS